MSSMNVNQPAQPIQPLQPAAAPPKEIDSTLERLGRGIADTVKENTKEGTFIGDNMVITGAGAIVGTVATGSAIKKTADAIPAVKTALKTVFVDNGQAVAGTAALGAAALLAEDAYASYQEGNTTRAALEGGGAALLGLGGTELMGRNFNIPVLDRALSGPAEATAKFIQNHGLGVVGAGVVAGGAYLGKEGYDDIQDGEYLMAAGKMTGAGLAALAGAEIIGHNYNINALKGVLSTPAKHVANFAKNNAGGIGGTALAGAGAALGMSGYQDLQEGDTMFGAGKMLGAATLGLGGAEIVGRTYNIPVMDKAFTGTTQWMSNNIKAVTGGAAMAGGAYAIADGVERFNAEDGSKILGAAEVAAGALGTLGGVEMIGRNFNIPVMNRALTGPVKYIFTSKAGITGAGAAISASGLGLGADGVRRLSTGTGILNDAIGAAEFTAGVAAATGGLSVIGYATGSERLMKIFPENADLLGAAALTGGAVALGKYSMDDMAENGLTLKNTATATGAGLAAVGGTHVVATKIAGEAAHKVFEKGYGTVAAAGLGAAAYKLGEKAVEEGKEFLDDTSDWGQGATAAAYGAGAAAAGAAAITTVEKSFNVPLWKHTDGALGAAAVAGGALLGKHGVESIAENGLTFGNTVATAGGAALATGGAQVLANKFGFEAANAGFTKAYQGIGMVGLGAAAYTLGEKAVEEGAKFVADTDDHMAGAKALGLATASAASGIGAVGLTGEAFNIPVLTKFAGTALEKGGQGALAIGLGAGAYKLGDMAVDFGQKFAEGPSWASGGAAVGLGAGAVLAGSGSVALMGKAVGSQGMEKAGMYVFDKSGAAIHATAEFAVNGAKSVLTTAAKHPFATLGVLAAAGAGGYYLYSQGKDNEGPEAAEAEAVNVEPVGLDNAVEAASEAPAEAAEVDATDIEPEIKETPELEDNEASEEAEVKAADPS